MSLRQLAVYVFEGFSADLAIVLALCVHEGQQDEVLLEQLVLAPLQFVLVDLVGNLSCIIIRRKSFGCGSEHRPRKLVKEQDCS